MTRTAARELAIELVFAVTANGGCPEAVLDEFFSPEHYGSLASEDPRFTELPDEAQMLYIRGIVTGVYEHLEEINNYILKYSRGWKVERISRTAAAVLRCAIYEILYLDDVPDAAAINEAVELAKGYDEPETVSFINGVLGSFLRGEKEQ